VSRFRLRPFHETTAVETHWRLAIRERTKARVLDDDARYTVKRNAIDNDLPISRGCFSSGIGRTSVERVMEPILCHRGG